MAKNISKQIDEEEAIQSEETDFRRMFYNTSDHIILVKLAEDDSLDSIVDVSKSFCDDVGCTRKEILSITSNELASFIQTRGIEDFSKEILDRRFVSFNFGINTKSGKAISLEVNAHVFMAIQERYVLAVMRNIEKTTSNQNQLLKYNNELKKALEDLQLAKDQLVQQEKLVGIGQLAAGVAHEINNPLGYICSNIEISKQYFSTYNKVLYNYKSLISNLSHMSREEMDLKIKEISDIEEQNNIDFISEDIQDIFKDVEDGLNRISEIVLSLRTFSRIDQTQEMEGYDLIGGIENTLVVAKSEIKHHARVVKQYKDIPIFNAFGNQINQILLNIILNALYAIKSKALTELGLILISTYQYEDFIICEIEDNGIGIDDININKIFNPFFTTKQIGKGTGLGLSIAYDIIVNKHGGKLLVESVPMKGTKFTIKLPITQPKKDIFQQ